MEDEDAAARGAPRGPEVEQVTDPAAPDVSVAGGAAPDVSVAEGAAPEALAAHARAHGEAPAERASTGTPPMEALSHGKAPAEAWFDDLGQPLPARAFDPAVAAEMSEFGSQRPLRAACMWCNGELASADLDTCPHCGAALKPVSDDLDIPGVTVAPVDLKKAREAAAEAVARTLTRPSDAVAAPGTRPDLEPPSDAVRRAMAELAGAAQDSAGADEPAPSSAGSPQTERAGEQPESGQAGSPAGSSRAPEEARTVEPPA